MLDGWGVDPNSAWHWGFGAAGVGMTFGIIQYIVTGQRLGSAGISPGGATTPKLAEKFKRQALRWGGAALAVLVVVGVLAAAGAITIDPLTVRDLTGYSLLIITVVFFAMLFLDKSWTREERGRLWMIFVFFLAAAVFWSVFEQAGSTLNLFADRSTRNELVGFGFPSSWFQSLNALFIIVLAPVFAWMWVTMGPKQPSSPVKFAIGLIGVGLGFIVLVPAAQAAAAGGALVSPLWLTTAYMIHTLAELCLSPVGLSSMTKLAPARVVGSMMGIWFLGASVGNFLAARMAGFYEQLPLESLFLAVSLLPVAAGIVMLVLAPRFKRLMGEVN
jgi:POT family proton-dependent oligopeptide transporter